jgi:hypothetical protein
VPLLGGEGGVNQGCGTSSPDIHNECVQNSIWHA